VNFNQHSNLEGKHAFFGASQYHWINYSDEKMLQVYMNMLATERGTRLHAFAAEAIELRRKMKGGDYFAKYVNDAIGYGMTPEVILYYSDVCFGTADAIKFDEKKGFLRIHDLKSGATPTHFEQLMVYVAYFCLEYNVRPGDIETELRIYQEPNDKNKYDTDVRIYIPSTDEIVPIMDKAVTFTKAIHDYNLKK
jgi:hypothetical protein